MEQRPNYFLADLPNELVLKDSLIREGCLALKRNRQSYLEQRPTQQLVGLLVEVARQWLQPDYGLRLSALSEGPQRLGCSKEILAEGLRQFFSSVTHKSLTELLKTSLASRSSLDAWDSIHGYEGEGALSRAHGPELLVHYAAKGVPYPTLMAMMIGILLRSAQFVHCAPEQAWLVRLFAHSIYENDAKLGSCLELAEWDSR
jgi:hypothetical protein